MLVDIIHEISRLKSLKKKPVMLYASAEVIESIRAEYEKIFFKKCGRSLLGLELRPTIDIANGEVRILTEW
jgi:hypothetical protein